MVVAYRVRVQLRTMPRISPNKDLPPRALMRLVRHTIALLKLVDAQMRR
jgi:hypothetical protein